MSYSMISQYVFKLRMEVSDKTPIKQLFILKLKLTELENVGSITEWTQLYNLNILRSLSKELVETGKIAPPN